MVVAMINIFIMSIGKMGYHQPRPYMVDDDVEVHGCSKEFGHPSGHSLAAGAMITVVALDYIRSNP